MIDIPIIVNIFHFNGDVVVVEEGVATDCLMAIVTETGMLGNSGVLLLLVLRLYFAVLFVI